MSFPTIPVSARAAQQLSQGHLWIFSNEIDMKKITLEAGSWSFFEGPGAGVSTGYFNPHSLIAGRVMAMGREEDLKGLLEKRLTQAFLRRMEVIQKGSCRLVFSEADFFPGLILDFYSGVAVLQSNTAGIDTVLSLLEELVPVVFKKTFGSSLKAFVLRGDSGIRQLEGIAAFSRISFGEEAALRQGAFLENGIHIAADFIDGQKTGFFLDQRENRDYLGRSAGRDSTILDLFCYSGAWGLYALKANARHVTFVDSSAPALALVRRSLDLNEFKSTRATLVESDVFDFLEKDAGTYQIVVVDPPAFVKSKKNLPQALKAYEKLNRLAWRRVAPGGVLLTSSCSYHLSPADFLGILYSAVAKDKGAAHVIYQGGQAADHPILLSMPETRYLKCVGLRKLY